MREVEAFHVEKGAWGLGRWSRCTPCSTELISQFGEMEEGKGGGGETRLPD